MNTSSNDVRWTLKSTTFSLGSCFIVNITWNNKDNDDNDEEEEEEDIHDDDDNDDEDIHDDDDLRLIFVLLITLSLS